MSRTEHPRWPWSVALGALLLAVSPPASAQPDTADASEEACLQDAECRGHSQSARKLSKAGQSEAAIVEYQAAYQRRPAPRLLYNIARLQHKLGQVQPALASYQRFLDTSSAPADDELRTRASEYRAQLLRDHPPTTPSSATPPPPVGPLATPPAAPPPAAAVAPSEPVYKKWWVWTIVGVAAAGLVAGLVLSTSSRPASVPAGAQSYEPVF